MVAMSICASTSPRVYSDGWLTSTPIAPFSSCWQISATVRAKVASISDGSATSR
ncbi:hypothetical protein D3C73_1024080 [compost metagenome]